jgi:phage tail sheath protein FI
VDDPGWERSHCALQADPPKLPAIRIEGPHMTTLYIHPGVYVEEVSFRAHPIEGVDTSTRGLLDATSAATRPAHTPEWTDHNDSDPGTTLLNLFAWLDEGLLYRLREPAQAQGTSVHWPP